MSNGLVRQRASPRNSGARPYERDHVDMEDPQQSHYALKSHSSFRSSPNVSRLVTGFMVFTGIVMILCSSFDFNKEQFPREGSVSSNKSGTMMIHPSLRTTQNRETSLATQSATLYNDSHDIDDRKLTECGIWMAPSSLVPFPGFGIFTTRDIRMQESILHQPDAVSIPLHDMKRRKDMPHRQERKDLWRNVFSNYVWDYGVPDHNRYDNPADTVDFQPGFGSLPNHHCMLASLGQVPTAEHAPYSDGLLYLEGNNATVTRRHGESPGTGAFSYSLGRDFYARRDLQAGEEIFLNYGHCNRPDEDEPDDSHSWKKLIIYPVDIKEAARILKMYEPFGSEVWPADIEFSTNKPSKILYDLVKKEARSDMIEKPKQDIVVSILSKFNTPAARQELYNKVISVHSEPKAVVASSLGLKPFHNESYEKLVMRKLWVELAKSTLDPAGKRDPAWIKENGQCLENLIPKRSTVPDAGFGAFAQFEMKKGDIVVPAPVLHVVDKEALMLYERGVKNPEDHKIGMSLLVNYCFGHSESSMLLCPMTSAMLLNHCSTREMTCGPNGPNAEVRWSSGWDAPSHEWRTKSLEEIHEQPRRLLSFEVIATRDIAPGEEVFIDYGVEWEKAWIRHVELWKPPTIGDNFVSAQQANQQKGPIVKELISGDLRTTMDHPYLFTGCQYRESTSSTMESTSADLADMSHGNYTKPNPNWKKMSDNEILATYATSGEDFVYGERGYTYHLEHSHWPCSVLLEEGDGKYTVRIHQSPLRGVRPSETPWNENGVPRILTNYSQDSIHYFVKASAIDQKLPNVFRQPIGLPYGLFPEQWKNKANTKFKNSTLMSLGKM